MRNELEVMRVLRVPPMGKLVVEVNGQRYENIAAVKSAKLRGRLLAAIGELISFADGYQTLVDAGFAPPAAPSGPVAPPQGEEEAEEKPLTPEQIALERKRASFLEHLESERNALRAKMPSESAPTRLEDVPPQPVEPVRPAAKMSVVEQIDAILQKHVAADEELAQRSIHLKQNPSGGLRIEIDGQFYDRPREIEDKRIQALIKRSLKEWESS